MRAAGVCVALALGAGSATIGLYGGSTAARTVTAADALPRGTPAPPLPAASPDAACVAPSPPPRQAALVDVGAHGARWRVALPTTGQGSSLPVVGDGTGYVADNGRALAVSVADGSVRWSVALDAEPAGRLPTPTAFVVHEVFAGRVPATSPDSALVGAVVTVGPGRGRVLWRTTLPLAPLGAAEPDGAGGSVAVMRSSALACPF